MKKTDTVLLDLDRTLVDIESEVDYCAALEELQRKGFTLCGDLGAATSWGNCTRQVVDLLIGQQDHASWQRAEQIVVPYELIGAERAQAMPGLLTLSQALKGHRVGIVTLASADATRRVMERYGIKVDSVVSRSFEVRAKPHPDQLLLALAAIDAKPQNAIMVGDSERDEMAAHAANVSFVGLTNGRRNHRFTENSVVVSNLNEVAALLE